MIIIGESINGTIPKVGQAILDRNGGFLQELAKIQYECGAHFLDVNAGVAGGDEVQDLCWLTKIIQEEVPLPLMLDSANPEALKAALCVYRHPEPPIINSISAEKEKWDQLFPLLTENKCKAVVLLMDDQGIPKTIEDRLGIAKKIYQSLAQAGIPPDYIFFDVLVLSVAIEPDAALVALETIKAIRSNFPQSHITCGVSNVSMGLPARKLINRTFLTMAIAAGLDTLLIDVRDQSLLSAVIASRMLVNQDLYCSKFLKAYREKKILA